MSTEKQATQEPKKLSRKEQKALTRDRIVDAGIQVLLDDGFDGFKMRPVANKAGIAQPTIYAHFENMEALLEAISQKIKDHYIYPMQATMLSMVDTITIDQLPALFKNIFTAIIELYLSKPELFWHTVSGGRGNAQYGEFMQKDLDGYRQIWSDFFLQNAHKLELQIDKEKTDMTVDCIFGMLDAFIFGYLQKRYTDKDKMVNMLTDFTMSQLLKET
ncbi:MAG: TetR/AcrR family transcriptional regulator [Pseudomonadales bacterium]|nr:TetR/AcrR family transcriptional regulator [Pseudomonadales bacterium]